VALNCSSVSYEILYLQSENGYQSDTFATATDIWCSVSSNKCDPTHSRVLGGFRDYERLQQNAERTLLEGCLDTNYPSRFGSLLDRFVSTVVRLLIGFSPRSFETRQTL
jgi:hypothetical protein